jgi:hypothetical protein
MDVYIPNVFQATIDKIKEEFTELGNKAISVTVGGEPLSDENWGNWYAQRTTKIVVFVITAD